MAVWCLSTGQAPDAYLTLTRLQREAFYDVAREMYDRGR